MENTWVFLLNSDKVLCVFVKGYKVFEGKQNFSKGGFNFSIQRLVEFVDSVNCFGHLSLKFLKMGHFSTLFPFSAYLQWLNANIARNCSKLYGESSARRTSTKSNFSSSNSCNFLQNSPYHSISFHSSIFIPPRTYISSNLITYKSYILRNIIIYSTPNFFPSLPF